MHFVRLNRSIICAAALSVGLMASGTGWLSAAKPPAASAKAAANEGESATSSSHDGEPGITEPSQLLELSFSIPGIVKDLPIKEGDVVKKGQLLIGLNEDLEKVQLEILTQKANSPHQLRAAEADRDAKVVELTRQQDLWSKEATSKAELQKAEVDVVIANIRIDLAKEEMVEAGLGVKEHKEKIRLKTMLSPVNGIVQKLEAGLGEVIDPQKPAIVVVSNDPLWVKLDLPTSKSKMLKIGQKLQVRYGDEQTWREAVVKLKSPVVDASADQQHVRLEMANEEGQASGQQVIVRLPQNVAAAE